ncbi:hypothetical protein [uncultured Idiomarina sp.]|uniref:hypothetical protein n=1 Tax=uncultured Idiomarina sp. TaxID=352961 RepID=UPI0025925D50|nr:hypothetical protein [uncultured Idiomarina sp.]
MNHREIQTAHEESVLDSFASFLESQGQHLQVLKRPDPPDAIIELDGIQSWVEITDAFQSSDWARSITSYAADDSKHQPYQSRLICEPDQEACEIVRQVILKKYDKSTMNECLRSYGQGILLVGVYTPLTSPEEIVEQAGNSIKGEIERLNPIFRSIFLYRNTESGHSFTELL